ncbi:Uncharacterised protein [Vibrio cholerae]|uniref:Uncharacterized protein n=1 Tax=Vibrio cholerae TaxID=666 RepID=A0A655Q3J8_VIBCL|nr:Uncharacterised protein [Vibrio cholerae]CSB31154.1 Uncharacterised protein [Vibrio cholerae]CSB84908.1 Uncharacterised protein [Vibrio cholerae]CSB86964.1 Uncharacterised protein [Vibrio cholerae]
MVAPSDPLGELAQLRQTQFFLQLGLANQQYFKQFMALGFQIGQQA